MIKRFVLYYIRKYAVSRDNIKDKTVFVDDIMKACHDSRQESFDEQTVPGRIYDIVNSCIRSIPVCSFHNDASYRTMIVRGIKHELDEMTMEDKLLSKGW